jgi:hypothetical protein
VQWSRPRYVPLMNAFHQPAEPANKKKENPHSMPLRSTSNLHPERFCPNCSAELKESRCKLSCPVCGFYLSCSDFY